jgi:hypothetical protein
MYRVVPSIIPERVSREDSPSAASGETSPSDASTLARPKSRIFESPALVIMMFSGFKSR